jgi:hypothetical protein
MSARLASLTVAFLACTTPVAVETFPAAADREIRTIALVPLRLPSPEVAPDRPDAADVVTSRVLEALAGMPGLTTIPPEEVTHVVPERADPVVAAQALHRMFGVDAVLTGTVHRFVTRVGSEAGATRPASVSFVLELRDPTGELLWRGRYDETQVELTDDLGSFPRAYARGFRWLSAEELARFGARELVAKLPGAG